MYYIFHFLFFQAFIFAQFAIPTFQATNSVDRTGPRITITATDGSNAVANGSITNDNTLTITFTSNETTSNFIISDIGAVGGSISSFSGSDQVYTATFTPSANRLTKIFIPTGAFTDGIGNNNYASEIFEWTYDNSAPTIISGTTMASDNSTITVKFSETVFNSSSGTGALEVADFSFAMAVPMSGNPAALSSSTPSSISKAAPSFTTRVIGTPNGPVEITFYDLDLDNDVDIIVPLNPGNKILWYENDGLQSFTERTIDASITGPREAWPVDLDLDGDIDIVQAVEGADGLFWYENNGSQSFTKNTIDGSPGSARSVSVGDIDGDGDLDISLTAYSSTNFYWYENNGSQSFTRRTISTDNHLFPILIDLDEDGDIDFVSHSTKDGSYRIVWNENDGSENFTQNIIANDYGAQLAVADLDQDGDYDVIGADYSNGHINWYANDGSESFTKNTIDNSGMTNAWDIKVGDVDGDGDLDVVGMASTNNSTADDKIVLYINNGSESFTEYDVDTDLNRPYKFRMADIDNDGDLDMMVGSRDGDQVIWYENVDGGYVLGVSLSGTAIGSEVLTVSPASNSIYDAGGNVASTSQSNNTAYLNDKTGPTMTITAANSSGTAVSDGATTNDSYLVVTFTSNETTTNFALADITVSGGSMASFSGSGTTYTANFTPTSNGATTIDVAGSTFTDASGNNNSAATQFNWTFDSSAPTISGNTIASDNSTIAVTFSEAVYNTNGGSGALQTSDFSLSLTGGMSTLSSSTPSSISVSSNTYTLGISLTGIASSNQVITVSPVSNQIFDSYGSAASTSQSNNTANLNDKNYTLTLNGSNEYAYYADNSNFEPSTWSIQAWIDPSVIPSNSDNDYFIHKNKTYRLGLQYTSSGVEIIGSLRYSGTYYNVNSGDQDYYVTAGGGWYHVILTFDGTNLILYVDGDEKDTNSNSSYSTTNQNGVFSIGRRHDTGSLYYNGILDEIAFWNTALSANAVGSLYNSGYGLNASASSGNYSASGNLVFYLRMQQNLDDSDASYDFTGSGISSGNYNADPID